MLRIVRKTRDQRASHSRAARRERNVSKVRSMHVYDAFYVPACIGRNPAISHLGPVVYNDPGAILVPHNVPCKPTRNYPNLRA